MPRIIEHRDPDRGRPGGAAAAPPAEDLAGAAPRPAAGVNFFTSARAGRRVFKTPFPRSPQDLCFSVVKALLRPPAAVPSAAKVTDPVRRTLRVSLLEGSVVQVFLNWTSGAVLTGYLLHQGAGPTALGLVASVPLLAQMFAPLAAWLAAVLGRRRLLTAVAALFGRGLWLLAALLPVLGVPAAAQPPLMVALVLVSSVFQAGTGTLWAAWMGDVVPVERRGRYFGFRTGLVGVVGMAANIGAGLFLDRVAAPLSFQLVIAVAVLCGLLGAGLLFLQWDPPTPRQRVTLPALLRAPLADPNFRRFLGFGVYWQFAVMLGAPFVLPYFLDELHMSFTQVAIWSAVAATSALATTTLWGHVADRAGNKSVLAIGSWVAGVALPSLWILAGLTGDLRFIWASAVFDAVAWGAIGPAVFNLALASAPPAQRASFLAMYGLTTGLAGFLGGLLSGPLLLLFRALELPAGWTAYHSLFLLSGLFRAQAWRLLRRVAETNAWRTRDLVKQLRLAWRGPGFFWRS